MVKSNRWVKTTLLYLLLFELCFHWLFLSGCVFPRRRRLLHVLQPYHHVARLVFGLIHLLHGSIQLCRSTLQCFPQARVSVIDEWHVLLNYHQLWGRKENKVVSASKVASKNKRYCFTFCFAMLLLSCDGLTGKEPTIQCLGTLNPKICESHIIVFLCFKEIQAFEFW